MKHPLLRGCGEVAGFVLAGAEALVEACVGWWPEVRQNRAETPAEPPAGSDQDPDQASSSMSQ